MTRQEWIDDMTDFGDLQIFCNDYGYQEREAEQIVSDYDYASWIEDDIRNSDYGWRSLRDSLNELPEGYDYYRCNGGLDYEGLTQSDFENWKSDLLDELDGDGFFDEEETGDDDPDFGMPDPNLFDFGEEEPAELYASHEKPKWMCHATPGDESIPSFEAPGADVMLGLFGAAQDRSA